MPQVDSHLITARVVRPTIEHTNEVRPRRGNRESAIEPSSHRLVRGAKPVSSRIPERLCRCVIKNEAWLPAVAGTALHFNVQTVPFFRRKTPVVVVVARIDRAHRNTAGQ